MLQNHKIETCDLSDIWSEWYYQRRHDLARQILRTHSLKLIPLPQKTRKLETRHWCRRLLALYISHWIVDTSVETHLCFKYMHSSSDNTCVLSLYLNYICSEYTIQIHALTISWKQPWQQQCCEMAARSGVTVMRVLPPSRFCPFLSHPLPTPPTLGELPMFSIMQSSTCQMRHNHSCIGQFEHFLEQL